MNIYEGRHIRGYVETTISRGRIVWQHGRLQSVVQRGTGRFVPLPLHGPLHTGLYQPGFVNQHRNGGENENGQVGRSVSQERGPSLSKEEL